MPTRRLLLVLAVALSVLLVVAAGLSRVSVDGTPCADRVWASAASGVTDRAPAPCAAAALERVYAVAASVMGLVLISGLLARRAD